MKSYSCQLEFSSDSERNRILDVLSAEQELFNECSRILFGVGAHKKSISIKAVHHLFYRHAREKFSHPAQIVIKAYKSAKAAYQSIRKNGHEIEAPAQKRKFSLQLDKRLYSWRDDRLLMTALSGGRVSAMLRTYPKMTEMMRRHEWSDPKIYLDGERVMVSIAFKTEKPEVTQNYAVGVDLGKRRIFATSEGVVLKGNDFSRRKRKIRFLKRQLKARGTKSAKRHLRKVSRKEGNISKNYVHHVANAILQTGANTIVIEDLSGIKKKKNRFHNLNGISQVPFYMLRLMLKYKSEPLGKEVVCVSPYMTSQRDHRGIRKGKRIGCRYFASDGKVFDADVNAAINIAKKSKRPVSFVEPIDGSFTDLTGRAPSTAQSWDLASYKLRVSTRRS